MPLQGCWAVYNLCKPCFNLHCSLLSVIIDLNCQMVRMGNEIALGSLLWVRLILLGRCSVSSLPLGWPGPGATGRFEGDVPGTRSGHFPTSHVSAFSCPWAGSYTGAAFWMQIPEHVALAAAGGAGGSTREALPLLIGERGLYWLPFNHVFAPAVLFQASHSLCIILFILGPSV